MLLAGTGCDTVEPVNEGMLVVEGFLDAGRPLAPLTLRQTRPVFVPYPDDSTTAVRDAEVRVWVDGELHAYRAGGRPGQYVPVEASDPLPSGSEVELRVAWHGQRASARSVVPPPIVLDSVALVVPEEPVEAVLLDSLALTDSLGVGAQKGFIYPIEVTLWWTTGFAEVGADSAYWVQTQLRPYAVFSSTLIDFFLRPEQVQRERGLASDARGRRHWTGVYAVPVETATTPLPRHRLRVAIVRAGADYARFATSRTAPDRREPLSNVQGAIGIFAAVAVDSVYLDVGASNVKGL